MCTLGQTEEETPVVSLSGIAGSRRLGPALCLVVLLIMALATIYTLWIGLDNYSNIGV